MRVLAALCLLAACSVPNRHFRDVAPTRLRVDGSLFEVRVLGHLAEAVRLNRHYAPRLGPIRARAAFATAQVSGCDVTGVLGDQAVLTGVLACDRGTARQGHARGEAGADYDCFAVAEWLQQEHASSYPDYDCSRD